MVCTVAFESGFRGIHPVKPALGGRRCHLPGPGPDLDYFSWRFQQSNRPELDRLGGRAIPRDGIAAAHMQICGCDQEKFPKAVEKLNNFLADPLKIFLQDVQSAQ